MKALFITILFLSLNQLTAQEWAPIDAEWRYQLTTPTDVFYTMVRVEKDTIVAGQECRQIVVYNQAIGSETNVFNSEGFTFERNDSIFFWHEDAFLLRYDFSASVGDTLTLPSPVLNDGCIMEMDSFRVVIDNITMEDINGVFLEKFHTSHISGAYSYYANSYFRTLGNIHLWDGLLLESNGPCAFIPFGPADLRCYKDVDQDIFVTDANCNFPSATNKLITSDQLKLYPNPVGNELNIKYDPSLVGAKFRLLNQLGAVVTRGNLHKINTEYTIDTNQLPKGVWWLEVTSQGERGVWKVVKI